MSLLLANPRSTVKEITQFIAQTFARTSKQRAVIAVSGGIDSALALTLLVRALGSQKVTVLLLPHHLQPMEDAQALIQHLQLPAQNIIQIDIKPLVDAVISALNIPEDEHIRLGNIKARMRMICSYDVAKKLDGLVCGTENKSEHYLGYFTRFGDAASDLEPLANLYKTQVHQLAKFLQLPAVFLTKAPSAGLWIGQTDEAEMGFNYTQADQVLEQLIDQQKPAVEIVLADMSTQIIQKVAAQVQLMQFKREVPYQI